MSKDNGGPAFPHPNGQIEKGANFMRIPFAHGMTLRAYTAIKMAQGILAGPCSREGVPMREWKDIPGQAVALADALLAELDK